jgi:3-isopropylmalate/(R)-2-methylmalate dehydratase large subunit
MGGMTIAEKILSRAARRTVHAGELAICEADIAMGTDGSIPMALDYLDAMRAGPPAPRHPDRLVFALDHYGPSSGPKAQALQDRARRYARAHGIVVHDAGDGIGHQLLLETGAARPGRLVVGADSHSTTYGAVNAFGTGIGSSDLAGIMLCGQLWLKVPESVRVVLRGAPQPGVSAKDVALTLARRVGADGANYRVLEFQGPGVAALDIDDRIVLSNMAVELGAKAGIFPYDGVTAAWMAGRPASAAQPLAVQASTDAARDACGPVAPDADAAYADTIELDLAEVVPQLALPHRVDNVVDVAQAPATRVDVVYLGTCTGGRVKDYGEALQELRRAGGIAPGVRVIVTPASEAVRADMERSGMLAEFQALGAEIQPPGCGSCCGTCGMVPGDGANVVSTANRNFKGRMGNAASSIFLASPRIAAAAAARGVVGGRS